MCATILFVKLWVRVGTCLSEFVSFSVLKNKMKKKGENNGSKVDA